MNTPEFPTFTFKPNYTITQLLKMGPTPKLQVQSVLTIKVIAQLSFHSKQSYFNFSFVTLVIITCFTITLKNHVSYFN
jgi:hypothetical protein